MIPAPRCVAALWALALNRFRDYMQAIRGRDMVDQDPVTADSTRDVTELRRAYTEVDGVAGGGGFGAPSPGRMGCRAHAGAH